MNFEIDELQRVRPTNELIAEILSDGRIHLLRDMAKSIGVTYNTIKPHLEAMVKRGEASFFKARSKTITNNRQCMAAQLTAPPKGGKR